MSNDITRTPPKGHRVADVELMQAMPHDDQCKVVVSTVDAYGSVMG